MCCVNVTSGSSRKPRQNPENANDEDHFIVTFCSLFHLHPPHSTWLVLRSPLHPPYSSSKGISFACCLLPPFPPGPFIRMGFTICLGNPFRTKKKEPEQVASHRLSHEGGCAVSWAARTRASKFQHPWDAGSNQLQLNAYFRMIVSFRRPANSPGWLPAVL